MRLTDFAVLSFDCYGTLIDWETGIWNALQPLLQRAASGTGTSRDAVLRSFGHLESALENEEPTARYPVILGRVHARLANELGVRSTPGEDARFGASIPDWPPFADSAEALRYLGQFYRLVILSNVDRASFSASAARLAVEFDIVCTAEDIGSYKPSLRNFEYLLAKVRDAGYPKERLLHVAESLYHDHAPANRMGLASAWIHRRHTQAGHGATAAPATMPRFDFRFTSLGELASAHAEETA
jgi:2-haloacid dehalogenase